MRKIPAWLEGRYEVAPTGCWLWVGAVFSTGYAMVRRSPGENVILGHRASYEDMVGPGPSLTGFNLTMSTPWAVGTSTALTRTTWTR